MSELKPCPFCGGNAVVDTNPHDTTVAVQCRLCTCSIVHCSEQEAIKFWNRRASPWIAFEDRKPEEGQGIVVRVKRMGKTYLINYASELFKENDCLWMPIPPLEEV